MNKIQVNGKPIDMTEKTLLALPGKELVAVYNQLAPRALKGWDKSKNLLVERILQLAHGGDEKKSNVVELKPKAKVDKKVRAPRKSKATDQKWYQLLVSLNKAGEKGLSAEELAANAETTAGSVACYLNYFRVGKRGCPMIAIRQERKGRLIQYILDESWADVEAQVARLQAAKE